MERKYKILVEEVMGGYLSGEAPELAGCYSQGKTMKELMENMKEAIELYLESLEELKKKPEERFFKIKEVVVNA
jgi:predicted RNase H-like HicB family nuclease